MKINKNIILVCTIIISFIILLSNNVYAATTTLTIDDQSEDTGFVEVDGTTYYVLSVKAETVGGTLTGVSLKVEYDTKTLEPLKTKNKLDLGKYGKFEQAIQDVDEVFGSVNINCDNMIFIAKDTSLKAIEDDKITVFKVCFKVLDDKKEKKAVWIDLNDSTNQLLYSGIATQDRYITNGVSQEVVDELVQERMPKTQEKTIQVTNSNGETKEVVIEEKENKDVDKAEKAVDPKTVKDIDKDPADGSTKEAAKDTDSTLAKKILPNTGVATIIGIIILLGVIATVFYKKMKKYKKF